MKREVTSALLGAGLLAAIIVGPRLLPAPTDTIGSAEWETEVRAMTLCEAMGNARVPRFVAATPDRDACGIAPDAPLLLCDAIYRTDGTLRETTAGPTDATIVTACGPPPVALIGSAEWETEVRAMTLCEAMGNARVPRFVAATPDRDACGIAPDAPLLLCDAIYRTDGTLRETTAGPTDATIVTACGPPPVALIGSAEWETEVRAMTLCEAMGNARVPRFVAATPDRDACGIAPDAPLLLCDAIYRTDGTLRETTAGPTDATIVTACGPPPIRLG